MALHTQKANPMTCPLAGTFDCDLVKVAGALFDHLDDSNSGLLDHTALTVRLYAGGEAECGLLEHRHKTSNSWNKDRRSYAQVFQESVKGLSEDGPAEGSPTVLARCHSPCTVLPNGEVKGRFARRPARSQIIGGTSHMVEPMVGTAAYASESERLDPCKTSRIVPAVKDATARRKALSDRIIRIRQNRARMDEHIAATESQNESRANSNTTSLTRQKVQYLKGVGVAAPQQKPRRLANALDQRGILC